MRSPGRPARPEIKGDGVPSGSDAGMAHNVTGWLQDDLHALVPWLLVALADDRLGHPASAARLKPAALQLLPPLLDGLHARRLCGALDHTAPVQLMDECDRDTELERMQPLLDTLVSPGAALADSGAS